MRTIKLTDEQHAQLEVLACSASLLVALLSKARFFVPAESQHIDDARRLYGSDEIEIDDDAGISQADDGTWVQAWVWVPNRSTT